MQSKMEDHSVAAFMEVFKIFVQALKADWFLFKQCWHPSEKLVLNCLPDEMDLILPLTTVSVFMACSQGYAHLGWVLFENQNKTF